MSASPVRIDRLGESDIGRVVTRDHALRALDRDHRFRPRVLVARVLKPLVVEALARPLLEPAFDIDRRAAALYGFAAVVSPGGFQWHETSLLDDRRSFSIVSKRNLHCG